MKSQSTRRVSILDALSAGLTLASRRPWLLIIPVVIDLTIWLAPQLSVSVLMEKLLAMWEALTRAAYPASQQAAMGEMITGMRTAMAQMGAQINLVGAITGNWLGPPSSVAIVQSTRLTFISDMLLVPLGLNINLSRIAPPPWQSQPIQVTNIGIAVLIVVALWLIGQFLVALYLRSAAIGSVGEPDTGKVQRAQQSEATQRHQDSSPATSDAEAKGTDPNAERANTGTKTWSGSRGLLRLAARLTFFSLLLGVIALALRFPLGVVMTIMVLSGSTVAGLLFALVGGITLWVLLWLLTSLFFVSEAMLLDHQPLGRSVLHSLVMIRGQGLSTFALVLIINLLMLGFRAVWGLIGGTPAGAVAAIVGNAFLANSMLLAIFVYYTDLRRHWRVLLTQTRSNLTKGNEMKDR